MLDLSARLAAPLPPRLVLTEADRCPSQPATAAANAPSHQPEGSAGPPAALHSYEAITNAPFALSALVPVPVPVPVSPLLRTRGAAASSSSRGETPSVLATILPSFSFNPAGGIYDQRLIKGRYSDLVDAYDIMADIRTGETGLAIATAIAHQIAAITHINLPPEAIRNRVLHPELLMPLMVFEPTQALSFASAINSAHHLGLIADPAEPAKRYLPSRFSYETLSSVDVGELKQVMAELVPGKLYQGDIVSEISPAQYKQNVVLAEVLDRLAITTESAPNEQSFSVTLGGKVCSTSADFWTALKESGHIIKAQVVVRATDVLRLKVPNALGSYDAVALLLMMAVGNREAAVPGLHMEIIFNVCGPVVNANTTFYHSIDHDGFRPGDTWAPHPWLGNKTLAQFEGDEAAHMAVMAGLYKEVTESIAKKLDLVSSGYAALGVCNDSVALVIKAVTHKTLGYPLVFSRELFEKELLQRLKRGNNSDDTALLSAVRALPCDTHIRSAEERAESAERLLKTLPWTLDTAPTYGLVRGMELLARQAAVGRRSL